MPHALFSMLILEQIVQICLENLIGSLFFHEAKINLCALVYKRLNGVCPDYMLELLKRNIDIRSTERQSRYGSLNLIFQRIKENQKVLGLFKYQPLGFGIHFPMN